MANQLPFLIRIARLEDASQLAELCGQLGYPVSVEDVRIHLEHILPDDAQRIWVAETDGSMGSNNGCLNHRLVWNWAVWSCGMATAILGWEDSFWRWLKNGLPRKVVLKFICVRTSFAMQPMFSIRIMAMRRSKPSTHSPSRSVPVHPINLRSR